MKELLNAVLLYTAICFLEDIQTSIFEKNTFITD